MNIYSALKIPQVVYSTESKYNGKIDVIEVGHTRKIKVGGIDQSLNWDSPVCEKLVWGKLVSLLEREEPTANSVLILGLGGGTIQNLISRRLPNTHVVSVEIDDVMVDIANKYFGVSELPNHRTVVADALRVVTSPEEFGLNKVSFNVAIVDIYVGEDYPDLGKSGNFMDAVRDMVVPGGLVIFNRIYTEKHHEDVDLFVEQVNDFLVDVKTEVVAGYTNSDNILVYGRIFEHQL